MSIWDRDFSIRLTSSRVIGKTRKLKTRWRVEEGQDLQAFHSADAEDALAVELGYEPPPGVSTMRQIHINKTELLAIVRKNRAEHRDIFLKSQKKYRQVAIKALDAQLKAARNGRPFQLASLIQLEAPEDHTEEYDRAIKMLEMSTDETILITNDEFKCYVEDKWHWSREWAVSNMRYTKSAKLSALAR